MTFNFAIMGFDYSIMPPRKKQLIDNRYFLREYRGEPKPECTKLTECCNSEDFFCRISFCCISLTTKKVSAELRHAELRIAQDV